MTGKKKGSNMYSIGKNDKCSCKLVFYTSIKWYSHTSWAMFNKSGFVLNFQEPRKMYSQAISLIDYEFCVNVS